MVCPPRLEAAIRATGEHHARKLREEGERLIRRKGYPIDRDTGLHDISGWSR